MVVKESVTINGHEIQEDDIINRLGTVYLPDLRSLDPSEVEEGDDATYHPMKVTNVTEGRGSVPSEVTLLDWKTGARETFSPDELAPHLGVTLFLTK